MAKILLASGFVRDRDVGLQMDRSNHQPERVDLDLSGFGRQDEGNAEIGSEALPVMDLPALEAGLDPAYLERVFGLPGDRSDLNADRLLPEMLRIEGTSRA